MNDISKINLSGTIHDIKDKIARAKLDNIQEIDNPRIDEITDSISDFISSQNNTNELYTKTPQNIFSITNDMIEKLGTIKRTFSGKTYNIKSIEYANGKLYVGYSLASSHSCCIARFDLTSLQEQEAYIAFDESTYIPFNSLCYFNGYLYTVSPEFSIINNNSVYCIVVIDPSSLAIVKHIDIDSDTYMRNLCIAPYGINNKPFIQSYVEHNGFINYMSYVNLENENVTHSVSRYNYKSNIGVFTDTCCLINLTGGNTGSVFAYMLSNYGAETIASNGIVFTDLSGMVLASAYLPTLDGLTFNGITVYNSNNNFLICDNSGNLYSITFNNIETMIAQNGQNYNSELYLPNAETTMINTLKIGLVTNNNTNIVRRFCLPGSSFKINPSEINNLFTIPKSNFVTKINDTLDEITVTGLKFEGTSTIVFVCCIYSLNSNLYAQGQRIFDLTEIDAYPILGESDLQSATISNIIPNTNGVLEDRLSETAFLAAHCSLQFGNTPPEYNNLLRFKGLF